MTLDFIKITLTGFALPPKYSNYKSNNFESANTRKRDFDISVIPTKGLDNISIDITVINYV